MDLREIDCFLQVAHELHFGRAARNLHVAQSSVSAAIQALEREIGGSLFERTSRTVTLTPLGERFRVGVQPAMLDLRTTLEESRRQARGLVRRLSIGFVGGGLYELMLPLMEHFRASFRDSEIEWVELSVVDQFRAVATHQVDAAFCRLPLGHDGLVAGDVLLLDKRKLVVPENHRLAGQTLVDPEELAHERFPDFPGDSQFDAWTAFHLPRLTPGGRPIGRGPAAHTVRECLTIVASGEAVITMGARAEGYYAQPGLEFVDIDLPPVSTALVRRKSDLRQSILDLDECAGTVAKIHLGD